MGKVFSVQTIDLKPGVSEADLEEFVRNLQAVAPGLIVYVAKGDRGVHNGHYAVIVEFESAEVRDRYFPSPDEVSEEWNRVSAPVAAEMERFSQMTTWPSAEYTDYHVIGQSK